MENMIERMLLARAGVIALTREKAGEIVDDLVSRGKVAKIDKLAKKKQIS